MCLSLLAMSVDLMWGGAGVLSLGHGLFFAFGGYLCAMHLLRTAYAATHVLPDFLLFMGHGGFPSWWRFADSAPLTLAAVVVLPALIAFLFGYVSFRSRVNGVYFSIITQALTYTAMLLMFRNDTGFGGNNGMTGFRAIAGLPAGSLPAAVVLATVATAAVLIALVLGRVMLASRLGRLLTAIRDDEARLRFLGYNTLWLKLAAWCLSASVAAIAGALYVPQVGIINPSLLDPSLSLEVAVWVAVGGRGGLCGAVLGAILVNMLKFWLSAAAPALWPFVLSLLVLLIVLALPNGLLDVRNRSRNWMTELARVPVPGLPGRVVR
jgi:urea transport system permease protein